MWSISWCHQQFSEICICEVPANTPINSKSILIILARVVIQENHQNKVNLHVIDCHQYHYTKFCPYYLSISITLYFSFL